MESYKFKDILFGLRNEYLAIQKELDELKKYVTIYNKTWESVDFYLDQGIRMKKVEMWYCINVKKNNLERMIESFKANIGFHTRSSNAYRLLKNNNDEWLLSHAYHSGLVDHSRWSEFSEAVERILKSPFAMNISGKYVYSNLGQEKCSLEIQPSHMDLIMRDGLEPASIFCLPRKGDTINIVNASKRLPIDELIHELLQIEFPKDFFSEYHRNVIEGSPSFGKYVEVEGQFAKSKIEKLEIIEEPNRLVLKKKDCR